MPNEHSRRRLLREKVRKQESSDSSDSEPDVEVQNAARRWAARATAAATPTAEEKKKKKKRLPPQQSIDKIWETFSQKRFSKAMTVLPFAPVAPSPLSDRANELLSLGYERAAEECRRKVRKIIQECRRVNMRYRDPGWDIDWDLKMGKGHCLNSLGEETFDVSMKNMLRISASVPKAVKRVHEIFEKPTFMKNVSGSDVKQGSLGDCWFISCVSGLANVPGGLQRSCVEYDTKIGIYGFVFYRDGEWIYSIIDDKLYLTSPSWDSPSFQRDLLSQIDQDNLEHVYRKTYQTGSKALFFAQNKDQNETWLPLMEKAYAKAHGDYASLTGGWIGEGLEDITGGVTTELLMSDIFDTDSFWDKELSRVNEEFLFGCTTGLLDGGYGERNGITEGHAYNIVEARTLKNGTRLIKLRNPWGKVKAGTWEGAWSDGSKEWTTEITDEIGHTFGSDSTFWISYEDFMLKFQNVDRTRLFRDTNWRCCQRWIGVDAPWKTSYNEKFHIKLTKESPLVLVLSQLDARYFQGLVGQYYFRIQFRLHLQDRPGGEDYIVRSHGNYLMDRSVSVELPALEPGNYSVFMSVVAERALKSLSVEDVVKRELKNRIENEKLAQVGQAYDLAHSKVAAHMEELSKLRKKSEQAKASDERKKERRKAWAKRHLLKDIQKRQQKKNDEKTKGRVAEKKAEREKKEAEEQVKRGKEDKEEAVAQKREEEKGGGEKKRKKEERKMAKEEKKKVREEKKKTDEAEEIGKDVQAEAEVKEGKTNENVESELQAAASAAATTSASSGIEVTTASTSGSSTPQKTPPASPVTERATEPSLEEATELTSVSSDIVPIKENDKDDTTKDEDGSTPDTKPDSKPNNKATNEKTKTAETSESENSSTSESTSSDSSASEEGRSKRVSRKTKKAKKETTPPPPPPPVDEVEDSSDSPIEDWEEWYSSDDLTTKATRAAATTASATAAKEEEDSEDEKDPAPWNAICVMGIRVYSKDDDLELRVVLEGGDLSEDGMGERGDQDLDNAQANAGGQRIRKDNGMYTDREDIGIETERDEMLKKKEKEKKEQKEREKTKLGQVKTDVKESKTEEEIEEKAEEKVESKDESNDESKTDDPTVCKTAETSEPAENTKEAEKAVEKTDTDATDDGLATYSTIVQKGDEEFEKASAPVKPESVMPAVVAVDDTMMWG